MSDDGINVVKCNIIKLKAKFALHFKSIIQTFD